MEGIPDEGEGRPGRAPYPERPRAKPNLWILVALTALSLALTGLVLFLTVIL